MVQMWLLLRLDSDHARHICPLGHKAWERTLFPHLTSLAGSRFSYLESRESCKSGLPMKSKYWFLSEKVFKNKTVT